MSKTLPFVSQLLHRARHLQELGLNEPAKELLRKLAAFRRLPTEVAEEIHVRLADIYGSDEDHLRERQHLASALVHQPNHAEYHHRLGVAYMSDEDDSLAEKARPHLVTALRLDPDNPAILADLGLLAMRTGQSNMSVRVLAKAHRLAPENLDILARYADALINSGQESEARDVLKSAMFRNSGDRRYVDLYRDYQFRAIASDQQSRSPIPFPDEAPVLLPFVRPTSKPRRFAIDGQIFRIDSPEPPAGPRPRRQSRKKNSR